MGFTSNLPLPEELTAIAVGPTDIVLVASRAAGFVSAGFCLGTLPGNESDPALRRAAS